MYDDVFKEQKQFGIIETANETGNSGETHYLPHHAVIKEQKQTSKVRIVFDASSKVKGPSLNDCLHKGPQLTPLLFDILLRFRSFAVALTADIEKAFLQISIADDDRDYLRFLWFDDVFQDEPKIVRNRFARVVFGVNSSPFLLNGTIRKHANNYLDIDPEFVEKVTKSFYVDDCISGENSIETQTESTLEKILGITWDENPDTLNFDLKEIIETACSNIPTKRNILSTLSSFYDPLGLIQPIIISLKILFQDICKIKVDWDTEIPSDLKERWFSLINSLKHARLNYDEMMTLLLEIELIVNNRPITYVYPNELQECLTPNHLLFSRRLESKSLSNHNSPLTITDPGNYFPQIDNLLEQFWTRWRQEYLTELRVQHRNDSTKGQSIALNDVVLVHDDKLPRSLVRL